MRRLLFSFSFIISELALDVSESQCVAEKEGRRAGRGVEEEDVSARSTAAVART